MSHANAKWLIAAALTLALTVMTASWSSADIHLIRQNEDSYEGYSVGRGMRQEIWMSTDKECRITGGQISVVRHDLGKTWKVDSSTGTYTEAAIEDGEREDEPQEKLHNEGYVYEPEYDWIIEDTGEEQVICGFKCRKFILDGDADYAAKIIELWVADDIGKSLDIRDAFSDYLQGYEAAEVVGAFDQLKERLILYEKATTEGPIAPRLVMEVEITTLEDTSPPEGIYELPDSLRRVE